MEGDEPEDSESSMESVIGFGGKVSDQGDIQVVLEGIQLETHTHKKKKKKKKIQRVN